MGDALSDATPLFPVNPVEENLVGAPDWARIEAAYRAGTLTSEGLSQLRAARNAANRAFHSRTSI